MHIPIWLVRVLFDVALFIAGFVLGMASKYTEPMPPPDDYLRNL